jgi:PadR family transcriptional regulator PadR
MPRENLGEFEQSVMLAILHLKHLNDEVYGVPIVDEIERRTGREVTRAAVYITLRRLEEKGLVASSMSDPTAERGGKAKRCVRVTPAGVRTLKESRVFLNRMWRGAELKVKGDL